jgi:signal transduction histidine kinase
MSAAEKLENLSIDKSQSRESWNQRILIVEDQKEVAESYQDILKSTNNVVPIKSSRSSRSSREEANTESSESQPFPFHFELKVVHSAKDAIAAMKEAIEKGEKFAMGFVDVLLGEGIDGIELLKKLQEMDPDFYGVLVTAYHDRDINSIYRFLGEDTVDRWDYLNKPFTRGEILQKARNYVSLWNFKKESELRSEELANAHKQLMDSERFSTVAAVARGVSHEFGNILVQITGKAELGQLGDEDKMRDSLQKIFQASLRANEILERFNHLSNPTQQKFTKTSISVSKILDDALDLLDHQLKTNAIKVCHIKRAKVKIRANQTAILQVLTNVIINAMHAMPSGGQLDFSIEEQGEYAALSIRDYGTGIAESDIDHVLDAFFTTKGDKGTGLGLSICKEIVEIEHGGKFKLHNHEVKGLVIDILLPKEEEVA